MTCVVSRAALETYFWLAPNADDAQTLKVFNHGFGRICAIAERMLLAHPSNRLELSAPDFAKADLPSFRARGSTPFAGCALMAKRLMAVRGIDD